MKGGNFRRIFTAALCVCVLTIGTAQAEESVTGDDWQYAAAVYLWGAGIGGSTASGSEVDVSFKDLFSNLNAGFMGSFSARKNKWLVITDLVYLDVSADKKTKVSVPIGPGIDVTGTADLDLSGLVFQLVGGYNLFEEDRSRLDLVGGVRYLNLDMDTSVTLSALGLSRSGSISESGSVWDGIVGVKGNLALGSRWSLPYYVDIGTGQSAFTWQAITGVTYQAAKWVDVALVYRHLEWDVRGDIIDDISFSGPALGAVFRF